MFVFSFLHFRLSFLFDFADWAFIIDGFVRAVVETRAL
jgi:serine/threonine protein kinase HipA of HipAB toxin-antitoxin module